MRWRDSRRSNNVEDRRGNVPMRIGGTPMKGGVGLIVLLLAAAYFGVDPSIILNQGLQQTDTTANSGAPSTPSPEEEALAGFVSVVLADTEDTWNALFQAQGQRYQ